MTRKEIEKRCREEMQQNIPDKNALWAKIESNLPEQKPETQPKPSMHRNLLYRTMAAAACFLFVAAGLTMWSNQRRMETEQESSHYSTIKRYPDSPDDADGDMPENEAEAEGAYDAEIADGDNGHTDAVPGEKPDSASGLLTYADLDVPHNASIAGEIPTQLLGAEGKYFNEEDVLAKTDCFVDVIVLDAMQHGSNEIAYELEVLDIYGEDVQIADTLYITTRSPYLLETEHEYVLPLYQTYQKSWELSYTCAPQIERTRDGKFLCHNGWYSLMTPDSEPVLCDSNGSDDFFYDRMYLTGYITLEAFLYEWESSKL